MCTAIIGNSGSGKSTLAKSIAASSGAPILDLDLVYWQPNLPPQPRLLADSINDVRKFCLAHTSWIIEGCYGDIVEGVLDLNPELVLLDPGVEVCRANCRTRPFESHKYKSKEEQDRMLDFLLSWVEDYYERDGPMSRRGHLDLFDRYQGPKRYLITQYSA
jgi:adenylate kinase family enzyme